LGVAALLTFPSYAADEISTGSGFFVTPTGYFATNFHVVDKATRIEVRDISGRFHSARLIVADKVNDLALLKMEGWFDALPISDPTPTRRGTAVITVGYPQVGIQGVEPKVTDGIISALSGMDDDPRIFQVSVQIQPGNSGGPLVTFDGRVVGVIQAKLSDLYALRQSGNVPQNVNYAIKSNYLTPLINGVPDARSATVTRSLIVGKGGSIELVEQVERATGLVAVLRSTRADSAVQAPVVPPKPRSDPTPTQPDVTHSRGQDSYVPQGPDCYWSGTQDRMVCRYFK
jgi:S1-C subfamily serine protease